MAELSRYRPTKGMLGVLVRAQAGFSYAEEGLEGWRCRRRGLIDRRGRISRAGLEVLGRAAVHG